MRILKTLLPIISLALINLPAISYAGEHDAPAPKPVAKPVTKPSGLTGAALPHCDPGLYVAGGICKQSPPNHYLPVGENYPKPCPRGTYAPAGSKSESYCV